MSKHDGRTNGQSPAPGIAAPTDCGIAADPAGRIGPHLRHDANKKYPRIVDAAYDVALGLRPKLAVMGSSFPTADGSAQRDYIHVSDLVDAHVQAARPVTGWPAAHRSPSRRRP